MRVGPYELAVATEFGPRITTLRREGSSDFFAHLNEDVILQHSAAQVYRLRGGHRLWAAPEIPAVTYSPDDHECQVTEAEDSVHIAAPVDAAGLEKSITVSLDRERLLVDHHLTNVSHELLEVAPWAITQLQLGGRAELPLRRVRNGDDLQADRSLVLWPYTDLADSRLSFASDRVRVVGEAGPALKVGSGPDPGTLSYSLDGYLFTKTPELTAVGPFADRGAVGQVFVKDAFLELETLGPIAQLEPGQSVDHREIWEIVLGAADVGFAGL
ncbi:MAG: hypothetical protein ACRDWA_07875 [Acidimicrobiia bacterium]